MIRVLVTGSRHLAAHRLVWLALDEAVAEYGPFTLVVGDCPTGADIYARAWARGHRIPIEIYQADWKTHGRAAGPLRNAAMVATGPVICLAFPLGRSPGTRGCMRLAVAAGIPVKEYTP